MQRREEPRASPELLALGIGVMELPFPELEKTMGRRALEVYGEGEEDLE